MQSRNQITGPGVVVQHPPVTLHEARSMSRDPSTVNPGEPVPSLSEGGSIAAGEGRVGCDLR